MTKPLTCIDLFCGAGGLSEGFSEAGFSVLLANDFDPYAVASMRESHPETEVLHCKIQDLDAKEILKKTGLAKGELDCLIGGPPCQAFSVYNHQRGMHDERSGLFREYLRIVEGLQPKFVVMENVTGIMSVGMGQAVKELYKRLNNLGYAVDHRILKAEEYGVPQERRRVFFVGNRLGLNFQWPKPTHAPASSGSKLLPFVNVADAIGDLPPLKILEGTEIQDYKLPAQSAYQKLLRRGSAKLHNHIAPYLAPVNIERLKHIPQGGSWRDIPVRLLPAGMKKARRCDHTKRYGRLRLDGLASTILTKCDLHWGAYIHPTQERTLTVREAARFQSFPDTFHFVGPRIEQFRQVGNAVPPLLAKAVSRKVAKMLQPSQLRELANAY